MSEGTALVPLERIERAILLIRGQKVMVDADLAALYGVPTKVLNQAVKRNIDRFPADFMFQLSGKEKQHVVTNCDHLSRLKFSYALPYVFTEHGAIMLANVLGSERAVSVSIQVVRAFVRLRELLATHRDLARRLNEMEKKYDVQFRVVFDAIRQLMAPLEEPPKRMGFHACPESDRRVKESSPRYGRRRQ